MKIKPEKKTNVKTFPIQSPVKKEFEFKDSISLNNAKEYSMPLMNVMIFLLVMLQAGFLNVLPQDMNDIPIELHASVYCLVVELESEKFREA
jgi:hypothetical protein